MRIEKLIESAKQGVKRSKAKPLVYSYIRFSTAEQRKGSGHERQNSLAEKWCAKKGYTLFKNYADLGVSAYEGRNASHGELSKFIALIDNGMIKPDSILLVESLDRISRQTINHALELFLAIINRGVILVTLCDDKVYSAGCEMQDMMMSLLIFARANDESKMKSQRKAASWEIKRRRAREGHVLGGKTPSWIEVVGDKYRVIESEANRVRQVFKDYVDGNGIYLLNQKYGIPKATLSWWLNNPVVIGTLTVSEGKIKNQIPNHYPAIIDVDTWKRCQLKKAQRYIVRRSGRTGSVNLFTGLVYDPNGKKMETQRWYDFAALASKGYVVQAAPLEAVVCYEKLASKFVTTKYVTSESKKNPAIDKVELDLAAVQKAMAGDGDLIASLMPVLAELSKRRRELQAAQTKTVTEAVDYDLVKNLCRNDQDRKARQRLREIIRDTIQRIDIQKYQNTNWHVYVGGKIVLTTGESIPFSFAYASRRLGYVMTDGSGMKYAEPWKGKDHDEAISRNHSAFAFDSAKLTPEIIEELNKLPLRKQGLFKHEKAMTILKRAG